MSLVLLRVDERLIHGQVVVSWGHELRPGRFIVVDDELADSSWEQDLYRIGAGDAEVVFSDVDRARDALDAWRTDATPSVLLTRDVGAMRRLSEGRALAGEQVNLGGLHPGSGRREVLGYLHLSEQDCEDLRQLEREGVHVSARDVPDAPDVPLATLLGH